MQRDRVLVDEMIEAAERIVELIGDASSEQVAANRDRRDAVLWNFTMLGEAANQISESTRHLHVQIGWRDPVRVRNRIVTVTARSISTSSSRLRRTTSLCCSLDFVQLPRSSTRRRSSAGFIGVGPAARFMRRDERRPHLTLRW